MNSFRIIVLALGLLTSCLLIIIAEPQQGKVEGMLGKQSALVPQLAGNRPDQDNPYHGYTYRRYGYYPGYTPRQDSVLPDKGKVLSEQICINPTISQVCRRAYEPFPGAVWRYRYATETERQADESTARRFAKEHGGYVVHENNAYVVYRPVKQCLYEVTACESLKD